VGAGCGVGCTRCLPACARGHGRQSPRQQAARQDERRQREPASERGRWRQREPQQRGLTVAAAARPLFIGLGAAKRRWDCQIDERMSEPAAREGDGG